MVKGIKYTSMILSAVLFCGFVLAGCTNSSLKEKSAERTALIMDTVVTVTLYGENAQQGVQAAIQKAEELEKILSAQQEDSELSYLNRTAYNNDVVVSNVLFTVAKRSLQYSKETNGALDCTIGRLIQIWGIGTENEKLPNREEIVSLLLNKGYEQVRLNEETRTIRFLNNNIQMDFGATAKGYAANEIKKMLEQEYGITCGILNFGGNIMTIGARYDGQFWNIGITDPLDTTNVLTTIRQKNSSMVTSGNYERFFIKDGERYHHILDTETGYPAQNGLISVTILSEDSMQADALSTAAFVMGLDTAMSYIESLESVEAVFVTDEGSVVKTSGIKENTFEVVP